MNQLFQNQIIGNFWEVIGIIHHTNETSGMFYRFIRGSHTLSTSTDLDPDFTRRKESWAAEHC